MQPYELTRTELAACGPIHLELVDGWLPSANLEQNSSMQGAVRLLASEHLAGAVCMVAWAHMVVREKVKKGD